MADKIRKQPKAPNGRCEIRVCLLPTPWHHGKDDKNLSAECFAAAPGRNNAAFSIQ
jgi:hypothetical protein